MTQTSSPKSESVVDARLPKDQRVTYFLVKGAIIFALVVTVVLLRLYRLDELPPGISQDAGAHGLDALQVLRGEHAVFFPRNYGREGMIVYGVALATLLLGRIIPAIYFPAALASAGTVFSVFWLGQLLFDRDESGQPTQLARIDHWGSGIWSAGSFPEPDFSRTRGRPGKFTASFSFAVYCYALVGVEAAELVANCSVWRVCRSIAIHLHSCSASAFSVSLFWN